MKGLLQFELLIPISISFLQVYLFLFICKMLLHKAEILKRPYAGMEYGQVIYAAAIFFGVFLIGISSVPALFQSFKTFQNQQISILQPMLTKFGQFFLIVLICEALYAMMIILTLKLFLGAAKGISEISAGNLSLAILSAVIVIGLAIILDTISRQLLDYITPHYLQFR